MSVRVTDYWTVVALGNTGLIHGWVLGVNLIGKLAWYAAVGGLHP